MKHLLPDFRDLTLAEQVAQLIVIRASGHLFDHEIQRPDWEPCNLVLESWLKDLAIGGVIFADGSAAEIALRSQDLQDLAKVPLLLAADVEEGVGQRFSGATQFPPPMALGQIAKTNLTQAQHYAYLMGQYTAQEAVAIGLNWIVAPVLDVHTNPLNPVINVRAFSDDPEFVRLLATAFIEGARQHPVMMTAKHFPGHGETDIDSHVDLPVLSHDRSRLDQIELLPFQAAIAAQVDSIMTAHLSIPALDPMYPVTLSDRVVTNLLRHELGFEGLIVTDALVMGAIAKHYDPDEAVVLAIEAGADLLMMPSDPPSAIAAICAAVEEGRIPEDRILASVERLWRVKQKVTTFGVDSTVHQHAWEQQMPSPIQLDAIARPEVLQTAEQLLMASHSGQGQVRPVAQGRTVIVVQSRLKGSFLHPQAPAVSVFQSLGYGVQIVDEYSGMGNNDANLDRPTVLQIFARSDVSHQLRIYLENLLTKVRLQGVIVYGNPQVFDEFVTRLPEGLPCYFSYGQMPLAQKCVLERFLVSAQHV